MTALRLLALPLVAVLLSGCPAVEDVTPETTATPAATTTAAPTTVVAAPAAPAGGCGCGSAGKQAGGCGQKVGECGGACEGAGTGSCGCGSAKGQQAMGNVVAPSEAKVGDLTKCLVSGGVFQVNANTAWVQHDGKSYPTCCPGCAERFKANPAKFLDV